ncbi:globin domain-containing protein [Streptomyces sp. NPDC005963]|uniref:globin domain-containing protein n=1 Tax=Streptomyces sp. NPDC005963 TaxID=3156721 RepID=UPI0033C6C7FA
MFEARQTMDAPTTTVSAGRSGDDGPGEGIATRREHSQGDFRASREPFEGDRRTTPDETRRPTTQRQGSTGGERITEEGPGHSTDEPPRFHPVHPSGDRGARPSAAATPGPDHTEAPAQGELPWPREAVSPLGTPTRLRLPGQHQALAIEQGPATEPPRPTANPSPTPEVSLDAQLVRRTLAEIEPTADRVTSYFYALLFLRHPELRALFPVAMDTQRDRLLKALLTAAEHMDNPAVLTEYLQHLGRGHRKYGTQAAHYPAVGEALLGALGRYATQTWGPETEAAWVRTYTTISQIMIDAAAENEMQAPAWWHAEVVSHDLRTPDIAVVTVRPDQPYPFVAGQYTSLETPWWPRVWRHYSFAGAPRPDGLLEFHVKAVPAGWVSGALVRHARPGDTLRLGPPAGSMTVDHSTDNGLLCLGGGTGIAPIKALVEDVAQHGTRRPVEVFYGARTDFDLYDIDTMLRLQRTHPWLSVRPVVDDRAHFPDAVRAFGPWDEYDGYLSGPPGMIRSGVHALRGIGIPPSRIRHDSFEDLVTAGS